MITIRVDKFSFEVAEHKGIQKITLHMPMTSEHLKMYQHSNTI
jgi:hypothetical protein